MVNFAAGGVATPADAALMMQLGVDGVFVRSGVFKSAEPAKRARAIVQAVTHYNDSVILAEVSEGLGEAMVGIDCKEMHFLLRSTLGVSNWYGNTLFFGFLNKRHRYPTSVETVSTLKSRCPIKVGHI